VSQGFQPFEKHLNRQEGCRCKATAASCRASASWWESPAASANVNGGAAKPVGRIERQPEPEEPGYLQGFEEVVLTGDAGEVGRVRAQIKSSTMAGYSDRKLRTQSGGAGQVSPKEIAAQNLCSAQLPASAEIARCSGKPRFRPEMSSSLVQQSLLPVQDVCCEEQGGMWPSSVGQSREPDGGRRACWLHKTDVLQRP